MRNGQREKVVCNVVSTKASLTLLGSLENGLALRICILFWQRGPGLYNLGLACHWMWITLSLPGWVAWPWLGKAAVFSRGQILERADYSHRSTSRGGCESSNSWFPEGGPERCSTAFTTDTMVSELNEAKMAQRNIWLYHPFSTSHLSISSSAEGQAFLLFVCLFLKVDLWDLTWLIILTISYSLSHIAGSLFGLSSL